MHEAITDGVGQSRVSDDGVPVLGLKLAGDDRRPGVVAIVEQLEQLEQVLAVLGGEGFEPEVVQDQYVRLRQPLEQGRVAAVAARGGEFVEEPGRPAVDDAEAVAACLLAQRAREVALPQPRETVSA
jgi:hypothetical protein